MQKKVLTAVPTLGIARTISALLSLKRHSQGSTHRADPLRVLVRWTSKTRLRLRQFDVFLRSLSHKRVPVSARRPVAGGRWSV